MRLLASLGLLALLLSSCTPDDERTRNGRVIAHTLASTVQLVIEREDGTRRAASAVVLAADEDTGRALILTTNHLLEPPAGNSAHVLSAAAANPLAAAVLASDRDRDLALLEANGLSGMPIRFEPEAQLGDGVWVVAFPWGRRRTVVYGVVSQIDWEDIDDVKPKIRGKVNLIDAPVSYGMSGGGVFDSRSGGLVGIVRGYRTAQLSIPGLDAEPLKLPVAGETTVVSTPEILCFLTSVKLDDLISSDLKAWTEGGRC